MWLNAPLDRWHIVIDYEWQYQEYKLCKGKDVVKETYITSSIISLGEEKGCQLILGVLSKFQFKDGLFLSKILLKADLS
jgi:hypothetical protein